MSLVLIVKAMAIAFVAAIAAWLPAAIFWTLDVETGLVAPLALRLLSVALLGSFAIGLPVAMLVFFLSGRHMAQSISTLFLTANLASIMMILASFVVAGELGLLLYGLPSAIAANTFAALGWVWILKPMRENRT